MTLCDLAACRTRRRIATRPPNARIRADATRFRDRLQHSLGSAYTLLDAHRRVPRHEDSLFYPRLLALCLSLLVAAAARAAAQPAIPASLASSIDSLARGALAIDNAGSLTIGLVSDTGLVWTHSYGMADARLKKPATATTIYRIGSITKQFTALMLLQLVRAGTVRLSDPVDRYLSAIDSVRGRPPHAPSITLVELATMRSGLAQEPESLDTYLHGTVGEWERVLAAALRHTSFDSDPGSRWEYSNIGYAALGAALAAAAGRPYVTYVRDEILRPLGMTHTTFELDSTGRANLAMGHSFEHGEVDTVTPAREHAGRGYKVPNGGLYSTVGDLARFLVLEMGGGPERVLPKADLARNFANLAFATPDLTQGYGLGFHVIRRGSLLAFGHPGSVAGYLATAYFDPGTHLGVVVLRSVDDAKFDILSFTMTVLEKAVGSRR
jgi:CubicO group peptidase (beta-lactamase class C family)